jgi:hypothetical protein
MIMFKSVSSKEKAHWLVFKDSKILMRPEDPTYLAANGIFEHSTRRQQSTV